MELGAGVEPGVESCGIGAAAVDGDDPPDRIAPADPEAGGVDRDLVEESGVDDRCVLLEVVEHYFRDRGSQLNPMPQRGKGETKEERKK